MISSIAVAAVLLQVLPEGDQGRAQAGTVGGQDAPRQLDEDGGHPGHAVIRGLQGDGSHLEGGVGEPHELGEEGVGAAEVLVATVRGRVVMVGGRRPCGGASIVMGVEVVQGQVLPAVTPSAQGEVVMVVVVDGGA